MHTNIIDNRILDFYDINDGVAKKISQDLRKSGYKTFDIQSLQRRNLTQQAIESFLLHHGNDITIMSDAIQYGYTLDTLLEAKRNSLLENSHRKPNEILSMLTFEVENYITEFGKLPDTLPDKMSEVNDFIDTSVNNELISQENDYESTHNHITVETHPFAYNNNGIITSRDILDISNLNFFSKIRLQAVCMEYLNTSDDEEIVIPDDKNKFHIAEMVSQFSSFKEGFLSITVTNAQDEKETFLSYLSTIHPGEGNIGSTRSDTVAIVEYPYLSGKDIVIALSKVDKENSISTVETKMWVWNPKELKFLGVGSDAVREATVHHDTSNSYDTKYISLGSKNISLQDSTF